MKRFLTLIGALTACSLVCAVSHQTAFAQNSTALPSKPAVDVDQIVRALTAKETEFRRVLNEYAFKRDAVIQIIGFGGQIAGEYHRVSNFTFDDSGNAFEKIIFFPMPTTAPSQKDLEDLNSIQTFVIEPSRINQYRFTYAGRERIDEIDTHVLDVGPAVTPGKSSQERFFQGCIWVDERDMQIVKARGKGVPEGKEKFPTFENYREQIDGRYWFPSYTYADDELVLDSGEPIHVRMRIRFTDYERSRGKVKVFETEKETFAPKEKPDEPTQGEILNGKAIMLPKPDYPSGAKEAGAAGTVTVRIVIDEEGNVVSAEAIEGHPMLRDAAVAAALKARFTSTRLSGQPVKVSGVIKYDFRP